MKRVQPTATNLVADPGTSPCILAKRKCLDRGLTPRNVTPEKRSIQTQVGCQKENNIEKALNKFVGNHTETYNDKVERELKDTEGAGDLRFVSIRALHKCADKMACGECASQVVCQTGDKVMKKFKLYVHSFSEIRTKPTTIRLIDRSLEM